MLRLCHFCIMAGKKGRTARKVADLSEWWRGQKEIKLLGQFADSSAWVDFTQGMDCRLLTAENIKAIGTIKMKEVHFAWDYMAEGETVVRGLRRYMEHGK